MFLRRNEKNVDNERKRVDKKQYIIYYAFSFKIQKSFDYDVVCEDGTEIGSYRKK